MTMKELVAKMEVIHPTSNYAAQSITAFFGNLKLSAVDLAREARALVSSKAQRLAAWTYVGMKSRATG